MTHTDPKQDKGLAWWHVNLGAWYKVNSIKVWNRIECSERLDKAHVYVHKKYIGQVTHVKGKTFFKRELLLLKTIFVTLHYDNVLVN